jgi:hypothetical protein
MASKIMVLNCPNCGALVSRETMKCEYCGADLIITADGGLASRGMMSCPKCGFSIPKGSWLCINCGEVVTKDVEALKELQRKVRFEQHIKRKGLPSTIREILKPDEYIYSSILQEGFWSAKPDRIYVVTDRRLIKLEKEKYTEIPWSKIMSVGEIEHKTEFFSSPRYEFIVHTLGGDVKFNYYIYSRQDTLASIDWTRFHSDVINVLENHNLRRKDLKAQICFLPFGQEFEFEKEGRYPEELLAKYSKRYPHNPKGVLELHIDRKMKEGKTREQALEELTKGSS